MTFKESDDTINLIERYICDKIVKEFLIVYTEYYVLTLAKKFQCLKPEFLFIKFDSIETSIEQLLVHLKYYKYCVVVCGANVGNLSVDEILRQAGLYKIKIIFLIQSNIGYYPDIQDTTVFSDLNFEAQEKILKRLVSFDGFKVNFETLASIDVLRKCDLKTLSDIISNTEYCIKKNCITYVNSNYIETDLYEACHMLQKNLILKDIYLINSKFTVISNEPGMGKSKLLPNFYSKIKKHKSQWMD